MNDEIQLPTLPVSLLKRRRSNKDVIKEQKERSVKLRQRAKAWRSENRRPAFFISAARKRARDNMRINRLAMKKKPAVVSEKPRLGLVVRLKREEEEISEKCLQVFKLLRLDTFNQAVFVKITEPMLKILSIIEPYIVWGYPNLHTVRDLITKRGRSMQGTRKVSIDNKVIEGRLGGQGILCLEDIVHELMTVGPNLRMVLRFLLPFKLMPPSTSWLSGAKRCRSRADRLTGMREEHINEMVRRMI